MLDNERITIVLLIVFCIFLAECGKQPVYQTMTQKELFILSASNFESKWFEWFNRTDNVETDGPGATAMWNYGIPYSLVNVNLNHEDIKDLILDWTQDEQDYWHEYFPGKVAFNYYDLDNIGTPGYPWSPDFCDWTGINCYGFVYWCAKNAGYNFINDSYKNSATWVNAWKNVGTEVTSWEDVETGDIAVFEWEYPAGTLNHHLGVVGFVPEYPEEDDIYIYQAFGTYFPPFYFKVCNTSIGNTKYYIPGGNSDVKYRRLPTN